MMISFCKIAFLEQALKGIGLSYGRTYFGELEDDILNELTKTACRLACKQGGHNKFLEGIQLCFEVQAPRFWWQEFDTYRVGMTKQSESTIHTLASRDLINADFEYPLSHETLKNLNELRRNVAENPVNPRHFHALKNALPEGFLQTRIVMTNAKVMQNIFTQRKRHKLIQWHNFFNEFETAIIKEEHGETVLRWIFQCDA